MNTICNDLDELLDDPQVIYEDLIEDLVEANLPFKVFETYRSQERQDYLYAKGRTTQGPRVTYARHSRHTERRAVDFTLDMGHEFWKQADGKYRFAGNPWTTGTYRGEIRNWRILSAWLLFGAVVEANGLLWGGRWKRRSTDLLGWDPYHTEVPYGT